MKPTHHYLLRSSTKGVHFYLKSVGDSGLLAIFTGVRTDARRFTRQRRVEFEQKYPHIRGRWVLE